MAKIKPSITGVVMFSIKNHWLALVILIGVQYLTGKMLAESGAGLYPAGENELPLNLDRGQVLAIHSLGGKQKNPPFGHRKFNR